MAPNAEVSTTRRTPGGRTAEEFGLQPAMTLESVAYEDRDNRTAYWLSVRTQDGKTYLSPKTFDRTVADLAREKVALFGDPDKDRLFTADNSSDTTNTP